MNQTVSRRDDRPCPTSILFKSGNCFYGALHQRVTLACSLHALGNRVSHHASKILKRHDAGVMLHGLCTLL
jgi:hypothetical protein